MAKLKTYDLVVIGLLAALAGVFQVMNGVIGIPTGFGMTVDLVAVPILLAFFLFGFEHAVWVLIITALVITVIAPTSWLGASMKFAGTLPMIAVPAAYLLTTRDRANFVLFSAGVLIFTLSAFMISGQANLAVSSLVPSGFPGAAYLVGLAPIVVFALLALVLLYVWRRNMGKFTAKPLSNLAPVLVVLLVAVIIRGFLTVISNYYYAGPIFWGMSPEKMMALAPWYVISGWNALQGVLEFGVAWLVAYKFGFARRYGKW